MTVQHQENLKQHFVILSLNHHSIPIKEIPKFSIPCNELDEFLQELGSEPSVEELVALSTCNRIEYFIITHSIKDAAHIISKRIANRAEYDLETLMEKIDVWVDAEAVEHLFNLVSGLDSMVVGDAQILGQVKSAYNHAQSLNLINKSFHTAFQRAFSVAKRVRKETGLGKGRLSISALAVETAQKHFVTLKDKVVTVIGAGKMGTLAVKYFKDAGVKELRIVNRSIERSFELAQQVDAKVYGLDEIDRVLTESDVVVSTTAATEYIITKEQVQRIQNKRKQPQLLIDISLPLDIDPAVGEIEGITFIDLETLRSQSSLNMALRYEAYERAQEIVDEELCRLGPWPLPFHVEALAKQLGHYAKSICHEEIEKLMDALPDLTPQQKEIIETQMVRVAERIVLPPRRNLRKRTHANHCTKAVQCLVDLFNEDCGARTPVNSSQRSERE